MPPGDTITIAGKAMNKNAVYYGGAAALGLVAYAWYKNSQEGPAILTADPNLAAVGEPTDIPGFSVLGPDNARIPQTNAEWFDLAVSKAQAIGLDAAAVGQALGKFLGRQPLTTAEEDLVRFALGAVGNPPEGGPYHIIEIPSGGVQPPPPPPVVNPPPPPPPAQQVTVPTTAGPVGLWPHGGDRYGVAFPAAPGATQYRLRWETSGEASGWVAANAGGNEYIWRFGEPQIQIAVRVQAGNSAGWDPHGAVSNVVYSA